MDCQSRKVDLAFAFLACGHFIATDFELRVLVGRVIPCAPLVRRADDCPPYQVQLFQAHGGHAVLSKLIGIGKSRQNRIVTRWTEIFDDGTEYWIQQSAGVPHIQVERYQLAIEMQLRLIV